MRTFSLFCLTLLVFSESSALSITYSASKTKVTVGEELTVTSTISGVDQVYNNVQAAAADPNTLVCGHLFIRVGASIVSGDSRPDQLGGPGLNNGDMPTRRSSVIKFTKTGTYTLGSSLWYALKTNGVYGSPSSKNSNSVVITVVAANNKPTVEWHTLPSNNTVESGATYYVRAKGKDSDGNLKTVKVWKDNVPFAFTTVSGSEGVSDNNSTSDTGPKTITFKAQSVDSAGAVSDVITKKITINALPTYTVSVQSGSNGSASGGGTGTVGTSKSISASPNTGYSFSGWTRTSGSAGSFSNSSSASTSYTIGAGNVTVKANFAINSYVLTVEAQTGGSASGGGTYNYNTTHTVTATANTHYRFTGWTHVSGSGTLSNAGSTSASFKMGAGNATVKANFVSRYQAAVSSSNGTITYGQSFTPSVTGGSGTGAYQDSWGNNSSWGSVNEYTPSSAGTYYFWVKRLSDTNYYESSVAGSYTLTVNKAAQAAVYSNGGTIDYLQSFTPTATGGSGDGDYKIRWDDPSGVGVASGWQNLSKVTPTGAGSYTYKVKREQSTNYLERQSATYTLVVNKIAQSPVTAQNASIDYLQSYTPSPSGGSSSGVYQMSWNNKLSWSAIGPVAPSQAGAYYYYVRRLGDSNYNVSDVSVRYTLTVNKIAQSPVSSHGDVIATGDSYTVEVSGGTGDGDYQVSWENEHSWNSSFTQTHNTPGYFDFWVRKTEGTSYLESDVAGPYVLKVVDPVPVSISAQTDPTQPYENWFNSSDPEVLDAEKMPDNP